MTSAPARAHVRDFAASDVAYIAVFAALLAAASVAPGIQLPFGVPITLQTLVVSLSALVLGPWRAAGAVGLWLLVGALGLPVFNQGRSGIGVFFGPSGGYLVSFLLAVLLSGYLARLVLRRGLSKLTPLLLLVVLLATRLVVIFPLGALGMARVLEKSMWEAVLLDLAFWPGDLVKSIVAVAVALIIYAAFPRLNQA